MQITKCDFCGRDAKGVIYYHMEARDNDGINPEYHNYDVCDTCLKLLRMILKKEVSKHGNTR